MSPTLGQRLKHARETKGLSLADVTHQTRIPVPRLKDMEEDNFNGLGGMTYARGFIQTYADLLEVNADSVLEQLHAPPLGGARDYQYLTQSYGAWIANSGDQSAPRAASVSQPRSSIGVVVMASLLLIIGGSVLLGQAWLGDRKSNPPATARQSATAPAVTTEVEKNKNQRPLILPTPSPLYPNDAMRPGIKAVPVGPTSAMPAALKKDGVPPKALPVEDEAPAVHKR